MLDIRLPIGLMFLVKGIILALFGLVTSSSEIYSKSLGINVNLFWGIVLVVFGAVMFFFSRKSAAPS